MEETITNYMQNKQKLEEKIHKSNSEISSLKETILQKENKITSLLKIEDQFEDLKRKFQIVQQSHFSKEKIIEKNEETISTLKKNLKETETKMSKYKSKASSAMNDLNSKIKDLNSKISILELNQEAFSELKQKYENLSDLFQQNSVKLKKYSSDFENEKEQNSILQISISKLENELLEMKSSENFKGNEEILSENSEISFSKNLINLNQKKNRKF